MQTHLFSLEISNPEDLALFKALAERLGYAPEVEEKEEVDEDYYLRNYELPENPFSVVIDRSKLIIGQTEEPDGYESILPETPIPKGKPFDREAHAKMWDELEEKYPELKEDDEDDFDDLQRQLENR